MQPSPHSSVRPRRRLSARGWGLLGCGCGAPLLLFVLVNILLLPIRAEKKQVAVAEACLSHVGALTRSLLMYAQDYDERLPVGAEWMAASQTYAPQKETYLCPALQERQVSGVGYAFNSQASRLSLPDAADPKTFPLLYDSTNLLPNACDPVTSLPAPPRHLRNCMGYLDGHAVLLRNPPYTNIFH